MTWGSAPTASLADARLAALDLRKRRLDGDDPLAAKREAKARDQAANAKMMRFGECAEAYIAAHREKPDTCAAMAVDASDLRLSGHRRSFGPGRRYGARHEDPRTDLEDQVANGGPAARQNRRGIGLATTRGYRQGENPARWRGPHRKPVAADIEGPSC